MTFMRHLVNLFFKYYVFNRIAYTNPPVKYST